jgi:hypothetical protein
MMSHRLLNGLDQILRGKWFVQIARATCSKRGFLGGLIVDCCDEYDRDCNALAGQSLSQLYPAVTIEADIHDEAGGIRKPSAFQEALNRIEYIRLKAVNRQHAFERGQHAGVIIEDDYSFSARHA